jgi:gluconate 2-dehydrogenase gamma chain
MASSEWPELAGICLSAVGRTPWRRGRRREAGTSAATDPLRLLHPTAASYLYLLEPEIRFLEAAVEHLIPTDELGPGARDAGVVVYIDRQLASSWGTHGRMYRGGPWMEGTPQQGYQSRFTPQEVYRIAIREIDQHCKAAFDRNFAELPGDRQLRLLQQLEKDEITLPSLPSKFFFDLLWRNTD